MFCGSNDKEISNWPWRCVFLSNFVATYLTFVVYAIDEKLADLYLLHLLNTIFQSLWWIFFWICLWKDPSLVVDSKSQTKGERSTANGASHGSSGSSVSSIEEAKKHPYSYEAALEVLGGTMTGQDLVGSEYYPNVCHTCQVQRPLRSKHCKIRRRCINKFDHFW